MESFPPLVKISPGFGGFDLPYEKANVVFIGVPLDVSSSYRPGYRFAPTKIREASANLETFIPSVGVDVFEALNITDIGDLILASTDILETGRRIAEAVSRVTADGKFPFILGGEHTVTVFSSGVFRDAFIVQLDAHRDLRDEYMGDRICHATVMRRILERVSPDRVVQLGVRSWSKDEEEWLRGRGIRAYTAEEVSADPGGVAREVERAIGDGRVYLTIDLDVLDPAFAPAVSTPEPGGISVTDALKLLRRIGRLNLAGADLVELVPQYDSGASAFAATRLIYELLAALAKRKG
jgi:agmatinase